MDAQIILVSGESMSLTDSIKVDHGSDQDKTDERWYRFDREYRSPTMSAGYVTYAFFIHSKVNRPAGNKIKWLFPLSVGRLTSYYSQRLINGSFSTAIVVGSKSRDIITSYEAHNL